MVSQILRRDLIRDKERMKEFFFFFSIQTRTQNTTSGVKVIKIKMHMVGFLK